MNEFEKEDTDIDIADIGMLILQARYGPEARRIEDIIAMREASKKVAPKRSEKCFQ